MTVTFPDLVRDYASALSYDFRSTTIGLVVVALLVLLLTERELIGAWRPADRHRHLEPLDAAILPLAIAFVVMVAARLVDLL